MTLSYRTALHFASYHGRTTVVQFLLLSGCGINVLDDKMMTPLVKVVQMYHFQE